MRVVADSEFADYGWLRSVRSPWLVSSAILQFRDDTIVLTREWLWQRIYALPPVSVTRLSEERFFWLFFSGSLRIEHSISAYPPLLFLSRDIDVLTVQLKRHGFAVFNPDT